MRQLKWSAEIAFRASGDDLHRLLCGERFRDCIAQFDKIGGREAAQTPSTSSETGQFRERQAAGVDIKTAKFGATMQLREDLARVE